MRSFRTIRGAAAALASSALAAFATPAAHAGSVTARLDDVNPASPADIVSIQFNGNSDLFLVGRLNWNNLDAPNGFPAVFHTFCIEIEQDAHLGQYTFTTGGLADRLEQYGAGLGATKADRLAELFGEFYSTLSTNAQGAAFQLAVWETIYDFGLADNQLLANGRFEVNYTPNSPDLPESVTLAHAWLGSLDGLGPRANLTALLNPNTQDQVTLTPATVPLPGAATGGLALMALSALRRRRRAALA